MRIEGWANWKLCIAGINHVFSFGNFLPSYLKPTLEWKTASTIWMRLSHDQLSVTGAVGSFPRSTTLYTCSKRLLGGRAGSETNEVLTSKQSLLKSLFSVIEWSGNCSMIIYVTFFQLKGNFHMWGCVLKQNTIKRTDALKFKCCLRIVPRWLNITQIFFTDRKKNLLNKKLTW